MNGKNNQPKNTICGKVLIHIQQRNKKFDRYAKAKRIQHQKIIFAKIVKTTSQSGKEKATKQKQENRMEKLTSKGKHKVKVRNHPHTNMVSKQAIMRQGEHKGRILENGSEIKRPAT